MELLNFIDMQLILVFYQEKHFSCKEHDYTICILVSALVWWIQLVLNSKSDYFFKTGLLVQNNLLCVRAMNSNRLFCSWKTGNKCWHYSFLVNKMNFTTFPEKVLYHRIKASVINLSKPIVLKGWITKCLDCHPWIRTIILSFLFLL